MARLNAAIETALGDWVANNCSVNDVVWDKSRVLRKELTLPFATLNFLPPISEDGIRAPRERVSEDNFTVFHRFWIPVSVNIYANDEYYAIAQELFFSLEDDTVLQALKDAGLYFRSASDPRDLTALVDTDFEFRIQRDFNFAFVTESNVVATEMKNAIIKITDAARNIQIDANINT